MFRREQYEYALQDDKSNGYVVDKATTLNKGNIFFNLLNQLLLNRPGSFPVSGDNLKRRKLSRTQRARKILAISNRNKNTVSRNH